MNKELNGDGVKSVALAPGFVDTPMTDFVKSEIKPEEMIRTDDIAEAVRFLLRLSPHCVVPGDRLPADRRNRCRSQQDPRRALRLCPQ